MNDSFQYVGSELDLFAHAKNWKRYWSSAIRPYVVGEVLDVGAGAGATAKLLASDQQKKWLALEPDPTLAARITQDVGAGILPATCVARVGMLDDVPDDEMFDTIIYADVLEHIEHDRREVANATRHLNPGGHLIVLAPAIQSIYTPFDKALGHFRRYSKSTLRAVACPGLVEVKVVYLDSVGMAASIGNKLILNSALPTVRQIAFWDGVLVPISGIMDPVIGHMIGKSVIGIWRRT